MEFRPGKLYRCPEYFLMIYPSKEKAISAAATLSGSAAPGQLAASGTPSAEWAKYFSERLNCQVRYSEPGEIFMFLEKHETYLYVLFGKCAGWIINRGWIKIESCAPQSAEAQNGA